MHSEELFKTPVLERAKRSVVTIERTGVLSAYEANLSGSGTGFLVDKSNGIILSRS